MSSYEESCYFFEYEVDMGGHIPLCSLSGAFEPQNCNKQCTAFISGSDVFKMVKDKIEKENKNE